MGFRTKYMLYFIANWKMNPVKRDEAEILFESIAKGLLKLDLDKDKTVVLCPPFVFLELVGQNEFLKKSKFLFLGAQNCFWEDKGAFTGEISPLMLKNLGCDYVIVGHSERKENLDETNETINKKIKAALKARLNPVLCVGEKSRDNFDGEGKLRQGLGLLLREQLTGALKDISKTFVGKIIFAYEPVWAIGTGIAATPDDALSAAMFIKKTIAELYGDRQLARKTPVLYGGSVDSLNAGGFLEAGLDGFLVGSASLQAGEFVKIAKT